jgi:hypothetical protein
MNPRASLSQWRRLRITMVTTPAVTASTRGTLNENVEFPAATSKAQSPSHQAL